MDIAKTTILGNSGLGVFALSTEDFSIVPYSVKESSLKVISDTLGVNVIQTTIANSVLVGTMIVGNSKAIFVPQTIKEKEYKILEENLSDQTKLVELNSKYTALGNLIVMNDKGAIVSDMLEKNAQKQIQDELNVEITVGNLLGSPLVGSLAMSTNRGALVHPLLSEEEIKEVASILRVKVDVCTINRGIPYPRVGIIANSKGAVIGTDSTGPESMRIFEVLLTP
ncbi:MAG: translation initiation factor IF-6 [Candidatus Heimdallarchaeota archaeon]|nr:translation initiation factor IF-6 [Candidatus Heimdallarchaeota archaeon]MCK5142613.1 translation initiation factor IF-6 [Candidatus Heimdallarchaeota archaeon]